MTDPSPAASKSLLLSRRFAPLFWCQFFSAFNDNFLKNALVFLILFHFSGSGGETLITLAAAVFIAPYFFLSAFGGEIADRYDKAIAQRLKLAEIAVAAIAVVGFSLHSVPLLFAALFLFGVIGALFGPIKYGILPDHLATRNCRPATRWSKARPSWRSCSAPSSAGSRRRAAAIRRRSPVMIMVFAAACWISSLFIPPTGEGAPDLAIDRNILRSTGSLLKDLRTDWRLWWGALVVSWFWLFGAVVLSLMPILVKNVLGGDEKWSPRSLPSSRSASRSDRRWLPGARPAASSSCRPWSRRPCSGCSRSILPGPRWGSRRAARCSICKPCSRRNGAGTSPSISPAWRSPAACSSCRYSPPFSPGRAPTGARASSPASTCSTPASWWRGR